MATREQKVAEAKELRRGGLTLQEIARRFGVTPSAVCRWLNPEKARESDRRSNAKPERKAAKRKLEHDPASRANCDDCAALLAPGSARGSRRAPKLCRTCWAMREAERVDLRARDIERRWHAGQTCGEIADHLGWSNGRFSVELHRLREKGYDLPYRYNLAEARFPEQVDA